MAHTVVGIDVAASGIKVAMLDASIRKLEFQRAITHAWPSADPENTTEVPLSDEALVAKTVGDALNSQHIGSAAEAYMAFDGTKATSRVLRFPMGDMKKIEAILEPELEDQIARPLSDVVYTYVPLVLQKERGELLTATAARSEVQTLLAGLAAAGHSPRALYLESLSLLALASGIGPVSEQNGAIVDIGHRKTHVIVMKQGKPLFARTIREGSIRLDRALMHKYQCSAEEARLMKESAHLLLPHEMGDSREEKERSDVLKAALKPLMVALRQTLHVFKAEIGDGRIYLTGGGSLLKGLTRLLNAEVGTDTVPLPLPEALRALPNAHIYTMAYAIAATSTAPRQPKLDFRRGEFSFRGDLRTMGKTGANIGWAVAALVLLAFTSGVSKCAVLRSDEKKLDQTLREVTKQMMGREINDFKQALAAIRQSASPEKAALPKYSAFEFFAIVSQRIDSTIDIKATELEMRPDKILMKGEAASYDLVEKVVEAIKGHECFKQVTVGKQRKTTDGAKVEFNLSVDLQCGST